MPDTFTLTIKLGNAAMQSPADVAQALHYSVAQSLIGGNSLEWEGKTEGVITDENGNTVGSWELT